MVELVRSKGFQEDVCNALTTSRISGYNIPDLVEKDFLRSIGISTIGDVNGLSRLFRMLLDKDVQGSEGSQGTSK